MIEIVSDINPKEWEMLVEASDVSTFFQTPQCYNFYRSLTFLTPFKFGVKENHILVGVAVGYIISEGVNLNSFFRNERLYPEGFFYIRTYLTMQLQRFLVL